MDQPNHERPQNLIHADLAKVAIEPAERSLPSSMRMSFGIVPMRVRVDVVAVSVRMRMAGPRRCKSAGKRIGDPLEHPSEIQNAQKNQHQPHRKFHREADARGNHPAEKNDSASHHENRQRMTDAPERPN